MMGRLTTLARPYAQAAFEYAKEKHALPAWEAMLSSLAQYVKDAPLKHFLSMPEVTSDQAASFLITLLGSSLDSSQKNFIRILAAKKRLPLLPDIFVLFKDRREKLEKQCEVTLITAIPVDNTIKQKMITALEKRFKKTIALTAEVDSLVLGGAIIKAGDAVIDGSVRGQLKRLLESLSR